MPASMFLKKARDLVKHQDLDGPSLREAIPYLRKFNGKKFVLKIGGSVLDSVDLLPHLVDDIVFLKRVGINVILVHGGSRQLDQTMKERHLKPEKVGGLRVTSKEVLEIAASVFNQISESLKTEIGKYGYKGVIFDRTSGLVKSEQKDPRLEYVGVPVKVETEMLANLADESVPIIPAVTSGLKAGDIGFNVNADEVASAVAAAIPAEKLILMTDVDGVLDKSGRLLSSLTIEQVISLINDGTIHGGMLPKVQACLYPLRAGVRKSHIIRGGEHSFLNEILTEKGVGTEFLSEEGSQKCCDDPLASTVHAAY